MLAVLARADAGGLAVLFHPIGVLMVLALQGAFIDQEVLLAGAGVWCLVVFDFINKRRLCTSVIANDRGLNDINVRIRRALVILDFFFPVVELREQGLGAGMVQGDRPPIDAREEHAMFIILHFQVLRTARV